MKQNKLLMTLFLSLGLTAGAAQAGDLSKDNLGRTIGVTCMGCHGFDGVSKGAAPSLKSMNATVMSSQMKAFKNDKRPGTIMNRIAKGYTDSEIDAVAQYFSNLK